uniref:39S ribosomal protein L52, mitochondrial n=1 Tax=Rhabditophanes sp. KR3021 TaxID=114890 RepID=A0AC35TI31_9BILA
MIGTKCLLKLSRGFFTAHTTRLTSSKYNNGYRRIPPVDRASFTQAGRYLPPDEYDKGEVIDNDSPIKGFEPQTTEHVKIVSGNWA